MRLATIFLNQNCTLPYRQKVKAQDFDSCITGSNPVGAVFVKEVFKMGNLNTCCETCFWFCVYKEKEVCSNEYSENYCKEMKESDNCSEWEGK